VVVIPKFTHKERMAENRNVFDFTLTAENMAAAVDTETSSFFSRQDPQDGGVVCEHGGGTEETARQLQREKVLVKWRLL